MGLFLYAHCIFIYGQAVCKADSLLWIVIAVRQSWICSENNANYWTVPLPIIYQKPKINKLGIISTPWLGHATNCIFTSNAYSVSCIRLETTATRWVVWSVLRRSPLLIKTSTGTHFGLGQPGNPGQFLRKTFRLESIRIQSHGVDKQACCRAILMASSYRKSCLGVTKF